MLRDKSLISTSMNFQIKSSVNFRLNHFTPFCIKVLLGKRTVFQSRRTYPNLHTILAFLSNEYFIMNFVFWQDRTVELSLAPNQKTRDCHTQRAIADNEFSILWHETSEAGIVRIAGKISSRREKLHIWYPLLT